jgi:hypothetical protein
MANIVSTLFRSLDAASPMTASPAPGPTVNPQVRTTPHSLEYRAVRGWGRYRAEPDRRRSGLGRPRAAHHDRGRGHDDPVDDR